MKRATYTLAVLDPFLLLVDLDKGASITNDAERVIEDLATTPGLAGRRVLYRDTMGEWDELLHDGARFTGFGPLGAETLAALRAHGIELPRGDS